MLFFHGALGPTPTRSRSAAALRAASLRRLARAAGACLIGSLVLTAAHPIDAQLGLTTATKACRLMPNAELEAHFGAKPKSTPRGMDGDGLSTCTATFSATNLAKLEVSPPGTAGVPTSIEMGLAGARMILGSS